MLKLVVFLLTNQSQEYFVYAYAAFPKEMNLQLLRKTWRIFKQVRDRRLHDLGSIPELVLRRRVLGKSSYIPL